MQSVYLGRTPCLALTRITKKYFQSRGMHCFLSIFLYTNDVKQFLFKIMTHPEKKLTRATLRSAFQRTLNINEQESHTLLETILETMKESFLAPHTEHIKISSFGTFTLSEKKERIGRNPRTLEESVILPRKNILFRASKALSCRLNGKD